jgi:hypothetical protein
MPPQQQAALEEATECLSASEGFSDNRILMLKAGAADEDAWISLGALRTLVLLALAGRSANPGDISVRQDIGTVEAGSSVTDLKIDRL